MKRNVNCLIGFLVVLFMLPFGLYAEDTAEDELSFEITSKSQSCYFDASVTLSINQRVGPFELTAVNTETGQVIEEQFPFSTIKLKLIAGTYEICISDVDGNMACDTTTLKAYVLSELLLPLSSLSEPTTEMSLALTPEEGAGELVITDLSQDSASVVYQDEFSNAEDYLFSLPKDTPLLLEVNFENGCYSSQYLYVDEKEQFDLEDEGNNNQSVLSLYPNPSYGRLKISIFKGRLKHISIYSFNGTLQYENTTTGNSFNISELPSGVYVVVLESDNQSFTQQIQLR